MRTLNNRITCYFSSVPVHSEGMYPYSIKRMVTSATTEDIFVGNFYYNGTDTRLTFDITDIVASDGFVIREDEFQSVYSMKNHLADKYHVVINWGTNDTSSSQAIWVAKVSGYNNKTLSENQSTFTFFDPDSYTNRNKWSILLQGFKDTDSTSVLTPHYPMYNDEVTQYLNDCPFAISLLVGSAITDIPTVFAVDNFRKVSTIPASGYSFTYISNLANVADYYDVIPTSDGVLKLGATVQPDRLGLRVEISGHTLLYIRYEEGDKTNYDIPYAFALVNNSIDVSINSKRVDWNDISTNPNTMLYAVSPNVSGGGSVYNSYNYAPDVERYDVYDVKTIAGGQIIGGYDAAIFDVCPKKYYLLWQDRYGSFQCQGFSDYANYSEDYDKTEVQDYQNRRRNVNVQIQSKWKLYSGWIPEELYPYYESIYTSQILILFDVEHNKFFTVMVNGNYEEKTYKNQKRLINMNLELEENKKQSIIY